MFRLLLYSLFVLSLTAAEIDPVGTDPTGNCVGTQNVKLNINTGRLSGCIAGAWATIGGGSGTSISLKTNGSNNSSQSVLNLKSGTNTTVTAGSGGDVTIDASAAAAGVASIASANSALTFDVSTGPVTATVSPLVVGFLASSPNVTGAWNFRTASASYPDKVATGVPDNADCTLLTIGRSFFRSDAKVANGSNYRCAQTADGVTTWELPGGGIPTYLSDGSVWAVTKAVKVSFTTTTSVASVSLTGSAQFTTVPTCLITQTSAGANTWPVYCASTNTDCATASTATTLQFSAGGRIADYSGTAICYGN